MAELATLWAAAIEAAVSQYLSLVPEAAEQLAEFEGKVIAVQVRGTPVRAYLRPGSSGIRVAAHFEGEPDTILSGSPLGFARLALGHNASQVLFSGSVEVEGDVEVGQRFKQVLDGMEIDWEEHLSHLTGDVFAHQVGRLVRGAATWSRQAANSLSRDVADYLHFEGEDVPTSSELESFLRDTETLRDDVARLEARIKRLKRLRTETGSAE
jgi:ubiquinone biosynthesis protein UbiJ